MTVQVGRAFLEIRQQRGLSQRAAANGIGCSFVHLCRVERNQASASREFIDKAREFYGVDVYIYAWCKWGDVRKLPKGIQRAAMRLSASLDQYLAEQRDAK